MKNLEHLKELARRAHSGTSFDPEKRGEQLIKEYTEILNNDLAEIQAASEETKTGYYERFTKYLSHYLHAKSRCVSTMIAGPSNFPVRQQQKYSNWEDSAYSRFNDWRKKALKAICKQIEQAKPVEQKTEESWLSIKRFLDDKIQTINEIDTGINTYSSRYLFVSGITNFVKRIAKNGQTEHVKRSLQLIREFNAVSKKPIVTEKHAIFKLVEIASEKEADKQALTEKESNRKPIPGGEVILNYQLNRLQIKHDSKPSPEIINLMKQHGFKWSPREVTWQRFLNNNSLYILKQFILPKLAA